MTIQKKEKRNFFPFFFTDFYSKKYSQNLFKFRVAIVPFNLLLFFLFQFRKGNLAMIRIVVDFFFLFIYGIVHKTILPF